MDRRHLILGLSGMTGTILSTSSVRAGSSVKQAQSPFPTQPAAQGTPPPSNAPISQTQAAAGLRAALDQGVRFAVTRLSKLDGYWGDDTVRIPLPKSLADIQKTLRPMGLSSALDDLHLSLNRAAETAAPVATDLFVAAIQDMSLSDAVSIVRGGNTAGTDYLQRTTTPRLTSAFTPPMQQSLENVGAVAYLERAIERNKLQKYIKTEPSAYLTEHAVKLALSGLFHYVGVEETAIRRDPARRVSDILRSVFG